MRNFRRFTLAVSLLLAIAAPMTFAAGKGPVGEVSVSSSAVELNASISGHDAIEVKVGTPDGNTLSFYFKNGKKVSLSVADLQGGPDGVYTYDMRVVPQVNDNVKAALAQARRNNDDAAIAKIKKDNGLGSDVLQSGAFTKSGGSFVPSNLSESGSGASIGVSENAIAEGPSGPRKTVSSRTPGLPQELDQVVADDMIVQGSLCVGFDCVDGESFGVETIKMKENNTRLFFEDTSTSAGFANNDWRIMANDQPSGGANKFSVDDTTNSKTPFTITANAPTNSFFMASTGKIGFRNSGPVLDLHMTTSDTPAVRFEQTNAGGFTAQTWDIGANEANFFVRDVTGGSRLSFRIRPGAPTSSIDISSDGDVGVGTASPNARLDVNDSTQLSPRILLSGQEFFQAGNTSTSGLAMLLGVNRTTNRQLWLVDSAQTAVNSSNHVIRFLLGQTPDISAIATDGSTAKDLILQGSGNNLGIGVAPSFPIHHRTGAHLTSGGAWTNASSRAFKYNVADLTVDAAKQALDDLKPVTYEYKREPGETYVGFIAEDVPALVATGDRTGLSPMDIVAVLTKVVKDQQSTIDELSKRLEQLEAQKNQ